MMPVLWPCTPSCTRPVNEALLVPPMSEDKKIDKMVRFHTLHD